MRLWLTKTVKLLEQPLVVWISPIGLLILFLLWNLYSWITTYLLSYLVPIEYTEQLKYQIGVRTVPVIIGAAGAFAVAFYMASRNKALDKEKHEREMTHNQIDAANLWLLDIKNTENDLATLTSEVETSQLRLNIIGQVYSYEHADPKVKLDGDLLALNFLTKHAVLSESIKYDFSNILSIRYLVTRVNYRLPEYIQELNASYKLLSKYDQAMAGDDDLDKWDMEDSYSSRAEIVNLINEYRSDILDVTKQVRKFLTSFPDIAEASINAEHQKDYMKILRF